ncbi:uncharacterized protein LOC100898788 [Galendromus occidentalis]|uniref:Uncharacterized protein LOC100898788 n=1 Tax=Galendromus occidentalis TaxID=34638 RepID=A0AAJ7WHD8_9ACAR|nr:uncharacterized protein LOC100898788 [Galendromus occidentalis]
MERRRHYDHSNWSPDSGRTWTYSSGDASEQCAAFMDAINCTDAVCEVRDERLQEELQLWLQRFASLQLVGTSLNKMNGSALKLTDPRVAQIPLDFDPPRKKRWSVEDEKLRHVLIEKLADSLRIEEWERSSDSEPSQSAPENALDRRRLSSQLSKAFQIFARTTDLPQIDASTVDNRVYY